MPKAALSQFDPASRQRELITEARSRKLSALDLYEPMATQEAFHACPATYRIIEGGNRSGKSVAAFVELARAAMGQDPYQKYPTDRALSIWVFGYDENHIGLNVYRLLFRPGAFRIIRDQHTGNWRAYRMWDSRDLARADESREAPPLIPSRVCPREQISWRRSKDNVFSTATLNLGDDHPMTGTEIRAFTAGGQAPMGSPVDVILIDEDIKEENLVMEMAARLPDRNGKFIWSVFGSTPCDALQNMLDLADEELDSPDPAVVAFHVRFRDNPNLSQKGKRETLKVWSTDPDVLAARDEGDRITDRVRMYPEFAERTHGIPKDVEDCSSGQLDEYFRANGKLPPECMRFLWIDPSHVRTAALIVAVPPPVYGDHLVLEHELYIANCTARKFVTLAKPLLEQYNFRAFGMDEHYGRQTQQAGMTVKQSYSQEFAIAKVSSELTGYDFFPGSDDVRGRTQAVHRGLEVRNDGTTYIRVVSQNCPNTLISFQRYKKSVTRHEVQDEPAKRQRWSHLMECLEYAIQYPLLTYIPPKIEENRISESYKLFLEFEEWRKNQEAAKHGGRRGNHITVGPAAYAQAM